MSATAEKTFYLAPIKGITDKTFREIYAANFSGFDAAIAPFITKNDSIKKIKELSPALNQNLKTVPQILTASPADFLKLSAQLVEPGCDEINWNIGCPYPMVLKRGEGAALLQYYEKIDAFLEKIFNKPVSLVSVKMRLGLHRFDEILSIMPVLNKYPVHEISIHARTADQMYDGKVNLDCFNEALKISRHSIIYNGDITIPEDIRFISQKFPSVKGFMIGRGALGNPFLAEEIKSDTVIPDEIKIQRILKFHNDLFNAYNNSLESYSHVLDKMHGIWHYLSGLFEDGRKIDKRIRKTKSISHYKDEVEKIFCGNLKIRKAVNSYLLQV